MALPNGEPIRRGDIWWVDFDVVESEEMRPMRPADAAPHATATF